MQFEFDPDKDTVNCANHGLSVTLAEQLEWELLLATDDTRAESGELCTESEE